jgi:hypothetical protein
LGHHAGTKGESSQKGWRQIATDCIVVKRKGVETEIRDTCYYKQPKVSALVGVRAYRPCYLAGPSSNRVAGKRSSRRGTCDENLPFTAVA